MGFGTVIDRVEWTQQITYIFIHIKYFEDLRIFTWKKRLIFIAHIWRRYLLGLKNGSFEHCLYKKNSAMNWKIFFFLLAIFRCNYNYKLKCPIEVQHRNKFGIFIDHFERRSNHMQSVQIEFVVDCISKVTNLFPKSWDLNAKATTSS